MYDINLEIDGFAAPCFIAILLKGGYHGAAKLCFLKEYAGCKHLYNGHSQ